MKMESLKTCQDTLCPLLLWVVSFSFSASWLSMVDPRYQNVAKILQKYHKPHNSFQLAIARPGHSDIVARVIVNTIMGGCAGGLTVLFFFRWVLKTHKWSYLMTLNGTFSGMVAECSGCNVYPIWAAVIVGFMGGLAYLAGHFGMLYFQLDDPLDASAVHGAAGSSSAGIDNTCQHKRHFNFRSCWNPCRSFLCWPGRNILDRRHHRALGKTGNQCSGDGSHHCLDYCLELYLVLVKIFNVPDTIFLLNNKISGLWESLEYWELMMKQSTEEMTWSNMAKLLIQRRPGWRCNISMAQVAQNIEH